MNTSERDDDTPADEPVRVETREQFDEAVAVSTVARKSVILGRTSTTTCRGCMSKHRRQEPVWTSRARSRRQGRQPRGAGAERSDAP